MEFANIKEASMHEQATLHRGLATLGGLLAGAGLALGLSLKYSLPLTLVPDIVGPMTMGWASPQQIWTALLIFLGAAAGAPAGWWLWLNLARLQTLICPLPALAALKRAAVPFAAFLPQITFLVQGRPAAFEPFALFAGLALGFLLLAFCERGDKRKVYFAHPTENEYHPSALFTHGAVITLGAGAGWYAQSLPGLAPLSAWGLWLPAAVGTCAWIASLLLAFGLGALVPKKTFSQAYLAVALSLLPLALLPLQSAGWFQYAAGGRPADGLRVPGTAFILPALAGLGFLAVLILAFIRLRRRQVEVQPAWEELFRALTLIAAVPLILFALAYWPAGSPIGGQAVGSGLDWLQEGESLAEAQALSAGRLPFKEILFRHGLGSDALAAVTAMNWFGPTVEAYRFVLTWLAPLGLVALYLLAIFCLPWVWALGLVLTVITGNLGHMAGARFFFAYAGFIFTLLYLQRGQWAILIFSGVFTALAAIASYTAGIFALTGHFALLLGYFLLGPAENKNRLLGLGVYAGAALLAMVPWWLYLGVSGSLGAYFENLGWVLKNYRPVFSLGLPNWGGTPDQGRILLFALPPLAVLGGLAALASALPKARERGLPWNVLLLTIVTFLLWWRFLNRGDFGFLLEALPAAAMLLAFILFRLTLHNHLLRGFIFGGLLLAALLPRQGALTLTELAGGFGSKNLIPADGRVKTSVAAVGGLNLPAQQAHETESLVKYLEGEVGSAESYFDFSNAPLLYFLVPRKPVVKSLVPAYLASWNQQLEAISNLADTRVKAVVFNGPQGTDPDRIPGEVRQYAISEYLLRQYVPVAKAGGAVILCPRSEALLVDTAASAAMQRAVDLEALPYEWGKLGKYDPGQGNGAGVFAPAGGVKAVEPAGVTVTARGNGLEIGACARETSLRLAGRTNADRPANVLVLQLLAGASLDGSRAQLSWGDASLGRRLTFSVRGDGKSHRYAFRVGALPAWVLAGEITGLELKLPAGGWTFEKAQLLALKDIPELAKLAPPAKEKAAASSESGRKKP